MTLTLDDHPVLIAQTGPIDGKRWVLDKNTLVGREQDCEISIPNRQVSRHHARFTVNSQGVWLEDLKSKNGTHVNGKPVLEPVMLQDGDIIQISLVQQFVFLSSDATIALDGEIDLAAYSKGEARETRLRLDKRSRRVWIRDDEIQPPLSVSQFNLLEILYEHKGEVVSRSDIIRAVYNEESAVVISDQALDALVRRLRDRLAELDPTHTYIVTVRGHGLRLENP